MGKEISLSKFLSLPPRFPFMYCGHDIIIKKNLIQRIDVTLTFFRYHNLQIVAPKISVYVLRSRYHHKKNLIQRIDVTLTFFRYHNKITISSDRCSQNFRLCTAVTISFLSLQDFRLCIARTICALY